MTNSLLPGGLATKLVSRSEKYVAPHHSIQGREGSLAHPIYVMNEASESETHAISFIHSDLFVVVFFLNSRRDGWVEQSVSASVIASLGQNGHTRPLSGKEVKATMFITMVMKGWFYF